jgi:hypothetical protein
VRRVREGGRERGWRERGVEGEIRVERGEREEREEEMEGRRFGYTATFCQGTGRTCSLPQISQFRILRVWLVWHLLEFQRKKNINK